MPARTGRRPLLLLAAALVALAVARAAGAAGALEPLPEQPEGTPWPVPDWPAGEPEAGVDRAALARALDALFAPRGRGGVPDTRALVAVHRGRVVAERYAEGFDRGARFHSWSMAKTVTQALVGILVRDGRLALDAPAPVPAWSAPGDPRVALTLRHLLHMSSGLALDDGDGPEATTLVARLLFGDLAGDVVRASAAAPLAHPPGSRWAYSTGTSMLLADAVARGVGGGPAGLVEFARRELAVPLAIESLELEFDAAGNFLGGGFVWATARDWARLGLLYLRGGVFAGRRVLPEGWVDFSRTPAPAANNGCFGAHLWLNREPGEGQYQPLPGAPRSAFMMEGAGGQYVAMVPDRDLVLVRLGEMQALDWPELTRELARAVNAFPPLSERRPEGER
jgi:CubicO group peptidase (beta-lactamase class C family)